MEQNELLLRTAFACMSCDGDIASEEVELIKQMANERHLFGDIDIDKELDSLVDEINKKGKGFLKEFKEFALKGNVMDMAVGVIVFVVLMFP